MRMIDCFYEVLHKTIEYSKAFQAKAPHEYEAVRLDLDRTLAEKASNSVAGGYSEEQYRLALYAVVAFIDEVILLSKWEHRQQWKRDMMQMQHFESINAGERFYEKLGNLSAFDPSEKDIREVYYYCLVLGFQGKYYREEDQDLLKNLKKNNLELLKVVEERTSAFSREKWYFPESYLPGKEGTGIHLHVDYRPFAYGIPVMILLVLFYLLRMEIYNAANYLVTTI